MRCEVCDSTETNHETAAGGGPLGSRKAGNGRAAAAMVGSEPRKRILRSGHRGSYSGGAERVKAAVLGAAKRAQRLDA